MNEYDSQLILTILKQKGYEVVKSLDLANIVLINTCAIRENAHRKIYGQLDLLRPLKKKRALEKAPFVVGILGCMAQNLKEDLLAHPVVGIVAGPDNYRTLPDLIEKTLQEDRQEIVASLSEYETYENIAPTRIAGVNAWLAIMRGCDNFCTFCVVPYTRGRERSRSVTSVVDECKQLVIAGFPQVTLLGQNVNSYYHDGASFADLIEQVAQVPGMKRIRFTSPHPKDFPEALLSTIAKYPNICNHIHLPLQAGSDRILEKMNRTYTALEYLNVVETVRRIIPNATLTTDIIVGFPTESEEDFNETIRLVKQVQFDNAFIFKYSERKGTIAAREYHDDITEAVKADRINRLFEIQRVIATEKHRHYIGKKEWVLIEGDADRTENHQMGKTDGNLTVVFPKTTFLPGEMVCVEIAKTQTGTLYGHLAGGGDMTAPVGRGDFANAVTLQ